MSAREKANNVALIALLILCAAVLFFVCPFSLVFKEQMMLFEFDRSYICGLLGRPAFLAVLIGEFLTQFFIYKWAAVLITLAVCVLCWDGIRRSIKFCGIAESSAIAALPVAAELVLCTNSEHPLSMTIAAAIAAWAAYGCLKTDNRTIRTTVICIMALCAYPLLGTHCLIFLALIALKRTNKILSVALALTIGCAIILGEGSLYLLEPRQSLVYPMMTDYHTQLTWLVLAPEVCILLGTGASALRLRGWIIVCLAIVGTGLAYCKSINAKEERELKLSTLAYFGKWDEVLEAEAGNPDKSLVVSYYRNLALAKKSILGEELLGSYQALFNSLFIAVAPEAGYIRYLDSVESLLACGDYSQAQHHAMVAMTFSPRQRSSRAVRRLAEIALSNGDITVAEKYLTMLSKTLIHRAWALDGLDLIREGDISAVNNNREILIQTNDFEPALRNIIESGGSHAGTATEYLLCLDLLKKNLSAFKEDYDSYYLPNHAGEVPPRVYQEALLIFVPGPAYMISEEVREAKWDFQSGNQQKHPDSYWYYYLYAQPGE